MDAKPLPRALEATVRAALADTPVVCLLGPRQCGKTTLARALAPRYGYVSFDDADALALARSDPNGFLAALPDPVILDEIQRVPGLLRALKLSVDRDRRPGRFFLTGSANLLLLPKLGDSLAGRRAIIELRHSRRPSRSVRLEASSRPGSQADSSRHSPPPRSLPPRGPSPPAWSQEGFPSR